MSISYVSTTRAQRLLLLAAVVFFTVNLALRLYVSFKFIATPYHEFTLNVHGPDQNLFLEWADAIRRGSWTWRELKPGLPFYVAPLYPLLLSLSLRFLSSPFAGLLILQALVSSALIWVFFDLGKRAGSRMSALFSMLLYTLYGPSYFYDACLIRASLTASLVLLFAWAALRFLARPTAPWWITVGVLSGLLFALRPNILFVAAPIWLLVHGLIQKNRRILLGSLGIILISFAVISPITVRNWRECGRWVPVAAQGADALLLGNDPDGPGIGFFPTETSRSMKRASGDRFLSATSLIFGEFRKAPSKYFRLYRRKLRMLINDHEIGSNYSFYVFKELIPAAKSFCGSFLWIFPLALIGILRCSRRGAPGNTLFFFAFAYAVSIFFIHVQSRYRYPVIPILIFFAGSGCACLLRDIFRLRWKALLLQIIFLAFLVRAALPLPSFGFLQTQDQSGKTILSQDPIKQSDYITLILSFMLAGKERHRSQISHYSIRAHRSYGRRFVQQFDMAARSLIPNVKSTMREEYLSKHGL